jgi:hypothetical protein
MICFAIKKELKERIESASKKELIAAVEVCSIKSQTMVTQLDQEVKRTLG